MNNNPIDIVLPWVDEKDTIWEAERKNGQVKVGKVHLNHQMFVFNVGII